MQFLFTKPNTLSNDLMYKHQRILAVIPARGGSKGIPRKNIRMLSGKPLIAYSIQTALNSKYVDDVILSSDDPEIIEIAKIYDKYADSGFDLGCKDSSFHRCKLLLHRMRHKSHSHQELLHNHQCNVLR